MRGPRGDSKPYVLAQDGTGFPVHLVARETAAAESVCGVRPQPAWDRVWRESISLREIPEGLCRECWHCTRFAETFEAALS